MLFEGDIFMSNDRSFFNPTRIVMIALFGALTGLLHIAKFPLSFAFPGFLEFDFSDIPLFIGTFALGPLSGCLIVVVKILIKLVCLGTANMFVGELANLLIGWAFVIPAGLLYRRFRTLKGAVLSLVAGSVCSVVAAIFANRFLLIPFYVEIMFGGSFQPLLGMMKPLFPAITEANFYSFYLWVSVLPFNVLRCLIASLLCFFVYKHVSRLINRLSEKLSPQGAQDGAAKKRTAIAFSALALFIALLVLFALLRYFVFES